MTILHFPVFSLTLYHITIIKTWQLEWICSWQIQCSLSDGMLVTFFSLSQNVCRRPSSARSLTLWLSDICLTNSQRRNFRLFKTERVCWWHFQIWWKQQKVFQIGRKHRWKRKNCLLQAISPFSTVFSKDLYCKYMKTRAYLRKS